MIGDLSGISEPDNSGADSRTTNASEKPFFSVQDLEGRELGVEPALPNREEDLLLRDTTASFADWVTSFVDRVIQLLENLPDEGANGSAGGASEGEFDKPTHCCNPLIISKSK